MKSPYPEVTIGSLASNEPGAFKIGPFGSSLKKGELVSNGIPVVGIENVLPNNFNPVYRKFIAPEKFEQLSQYKMEPFDVVVTTMGTVGRSAVVPENIGTAIIDSHLFRMRLNRNKVDPAYLCYALNGYAPLMNQLKEKAVGAIMAGLNTKILRECTIPLPPLTEQQRIAARLNEQMTAVSQARQAAEAQLRAARELPSAYLREVFEGQAAKKYPQKQLFELCDIQLGKMLSPASKTGVRSRPYLRNFNVQWGYFDLSDVAEMDFGEEQEDRYALTSGDLLVCEGGEPGRAAVWDGALNPCYYQKALHRLRPVNHSVDTEYVMYRLWLGAIEGEFTDSNAQTTIAHLPKIRLEKLSILVPPLPEQKRLAKQIKEKMKAADTLQKSLEAQLAEINQLPSALLRRAFSGEL